MNLTWHNTRTPGTQVVADGTIRGLTAEIRASTTGDRAGLVADVECLLRRPDDQLLPPRGSQTATPGDTNTMVRSWRRCCAGTTRRAE